jgi:hypothetical protein
MLPCGSQHVRAVESSQSPEPAGRDATRTTPGRKVWFGSAPRLLSRWVLILLSVYIGGKVGAQVVGRLRDRLLSSIGKDLIVSPP